MEFITAFHFATGFDKRKAKTLKEHPELFDKDEKNFKGIEEDGKSWAKLPLLLKTCTIHAKEVEYIRCKMAMGHGRQIIVLFSPAEYMRHVFCSYGQYNPVTDPNQKTVVYKDGNWSYMKTFIDNVTGACQITNRSGNALFTQGGFQDHIPKNTYKKDNTWMLHCNTPNCKYIF